MADGGWPMADGRWQMADGRWRMADGRWPMADGGSGFGLAAKEGVGVLFAEAGEVRGAPFRGQGAVFGAHALQAMVVIVGVGPVELAAGGRVFGGVATAGFMHFHGEWWRASPPGVRCFWGQVILMVRPFRGRLAQPIQFRWYMTLPVPGSTGPT